MPNTLSGWISALVTLGCIILAAWSFSLGSGLRTLRAEVSEQQANAAKGQALGKVNDTLIQMMARLAAETNDPALTGLLSANGVTFRLTPADQTPANGDAQ